MMHDEVEELLGAYALDATDPQERAEIEAHLVECPRCRSEVEAHREVIALFAGSGVGSEGPPGLWDKIASSISDDPGRRATPPTPLLPGGAVRRRGRRNRVGRTGARWAPGVAVAAVAAGVLAFLGTDVASLSSRVAGLKSEVDNYELGSILTARHATVNMVSARGVPVAHVYLSPNGQALLYQSSLPVLPKGQTYEMWGLSRGQDVSLGLVGGGPSILAAFAVGRSTAEIMVTAEPDGGTARPTTRVLAAAKLPAGYVG